MASRKLLGAENRLEQQSKWILEHGANEAGYIARYGADDDPQRIGDGGAAIYAADYQRYLDAIREVARLEKREEAQLSLWQEGGL
jgi:hypothetical protein